MAGSGRPADAGRRGPVRRLPVRKPTGFRIDDASRLELEVAAAIYVDGSLQGVIQVAVEEYLQKRRLDPAFLAAAEVARRRRAR